MKVLVIEMTRTVERRLASGDAQTLLGGQRYTMSDEDAAPFLKPTKRFVKENGALAEKVVPPAATLIQETDVPDATAQAKLAEAKAAARTEEVEKTYFAQAREHEAIRDAEATANAPAPVATVPAVAGAASTDDEDTGE